MNKLIQERQEDDSPTAGADDEDLSDEQAMDVIHAVFNNSARKKQLAKVLRWNRDGTYRIESAEVGSYTDFYSQANYTYLKASYPWLMSVEGGLGFDEDEQKGSFDDFNSYLADIPEDEWEAFLEDMERLRHHGVLDEDGASELENEEQGRWMREDGGPDLVKSMVKEAENAYDAYLLSKVTPGMIWSWCGEMDYYPESQGDGSVYMNMEEFGEDEENRQWFLDQLEDDFAGWLAIKRQCFDDTAGDMFDRMMQAMASVNEQVDQVYQRFDSVEQIFQLFLETFPDDRRADDQPYWYQWKESYNTPVFWKVGYEVTNRGTYPNWKDGYTLALEYLQEQEWFFKLVVNWYRRGPKDHPEFKFEHLAEELSPDESEELSLDDISRYFHHSGMREELFYQDDVITVLLPSNYQAVNYYLEVGGFPQINEQLWRDVFLHRDLFVILARAKEGDSSQRLIGLVYGDEYGLHRWLGNKSGDKSIDPLINDTVTGKSVRRMFLKFYRNRASETGDKSGAILLKLGGAIELRRADNKSHLDIGNHGVALGLYYVAKHKYKLAAKAFNRSESTMASKGVWLRYPDVSALAPLFDNEDAANTVFSNDHYDWFDHYYEHRNLPDVKDVVPFLSEKAIQHIWASMVNRKVWFPDAGENKRGDYVILTKELMANYDSETVIGWVSDLSDEDSEDGVFDDIIDAIKKDGARMLTGASQDTVNTAYVKAGVDHLDGSDQKWDSDPTAKGSDFFTFFVPWTSVSDWAEKYDNDTGETYTTSKHGGSLENLAIEANKEAVRMDSGDHEATWSDVNKDYASDCVNEIYELEAPEPPPGSPHYVDPNQLALPLGEALLMEEHYSYSTTQIDLPSAIADFVIEWGQFNIPDEMLVAQAKQDYGNEGDGREREIHVTVLYGIVAQEVPSELREIAKSVSPFPVGLGKVSLFDSNPDYDVVKLDVDSTALHALNSQIAAAVENKNSHPTYVPHVTLAYVRKGSCNKLVGQDPFKAKDVTREFTAAGLKFKGSGDDDDSNRAIETLLFSKVNKQAPRSVSEAVIAPTDDDMQAIELAISTAARASNRNPKLFADLANDELAPYHIAFDRVMHARYTARYPGAQATATPDGIYLPLPTAYDLENKMWLKHNMLLIYHELVHMGQMGHSSKPREMYTKALAYVTPGGRPDSDRYLRQKQEIMAYAASMVDLWKQQGVAPDQMLSNIMNGRSWSIGQKYWISRKTHPEVFNRFVKQATEYVHKLNEGEIKVTDPFASCSFPADPDRIEQFLHSKRRRVISRPVL